MIGRIATFAQLERLAQLKADEHGTREFKTTSWRMHGHAFFVPMTSAGTDAQVQGTVILTKDGHECDEAEAVGAELENDATGIELSSS